LDFYYTEPRGLRFHCLDNEQVGKFSIKELDFNYQNEVKKIFIEFEINCVVNGVVTKNAVTGSLSYDENDMIKTNSLKFIE